MDDSRFFAWLDGELEPADAAEVAAVVAADPQLSAKADTHRAFGRTLRAAFDPIAAAPVPASMLGASHAREPAVADIVAARRRRTRHLPGPAQWAAMAATLVIGIVTGTMIASDNSAPIANEAGRMVAAGDLEAALQTRLASAPADSGARIGLTYRDASGAICRTFADAGSSGLACRENDEWRIRGLFQGRPADEGEYRMASGSDPRLANLVDESISGEPFDADAERQAKESGWR